MKNRRGLCKHGGEMCTKCEREGWGSSNPARTATEGQFKNGKPVGDRKEYKHAVTVKGIKIEWGKKK